MQGDHEVKSTRDPEGIDAQRDDASRPPIICVLPANGSVISPKARQRALVARLPIQRPEMPDGPLTRAQELVGLATANVDDRTPTTLYRLFAADDSLLYVGIAGNPGRRFEQHRRDKAWWGQVATIRLEHFDYRRQAESAEQHAIVNECPPMNEIGADEVIEWTTPRRLPVPTGPVPIAPGSLGLAR